MNNYPDILFGLDIGDLIFSPVRVCEKDGVFDFVITCDLVEKFSGLLSGNFGCRLYRDDIERLILYFDSHIRGLKFEGRGESPVFVPLESDIQIRGLEGEVVDFSDGYFSIIIFFNCGKANEYSSNGYFGFEAVVEVTAVYEFCDGLKRLIYDRAS